MTNSLIDVQRSVLKFKHVQATSIWAFVRGNGELNYEEHNHLKRCKHCDAIFKYFGIHAGPPHLSDAIENRATAALIAFGCFGDSWKTSNEFCLHDAKI